MNDSKESLSLAGLEYFTFRDYLRIFSRRKWFILVTTFALALGTAVVTYFLPDAYKATTVIVVDPQKVPDSYVNSTVTASGAQRLAALRQEILSATRLNQIIDEMSLYKKLKNKKSQEEIVAAMQKDISVDSASAPAVVKGQKVLEAFTISYTNQSALVAAQVANRLASLFIEENIKSREQSVLGTADFLSKEVEDAQKDLKEKEDQITAMKTNDVGELPQSEVIHVQALNSLQTQLQSERDSIERDQQQKSALETTLANSPSVVNLDSQESPAVAAMETQKAQLQDEVDQLRKRYGPSFPDVIKKNMAITDLEKRIEETKKKEAAKGAPEPLKEHNPVLQSQITKVDDDIQKHQIREQEIEKQIILHQTQLERIPLFQQRMSAVQRDYDAAEEHYKKLVERKFSADMATDMEVRQKGERFEILDPAQVPTQPASPDRPLLNLIGLGAGLVLSIIIAFALEILNTSVKTEREVTGQLGVPIFGEVPWLPTKTNVRNRRLQVLLTCACAAVLAAGYSVLVVFTWR
jgi:succinoglycan biosynthesis transport protein ExoP